MSKAIIHVGTHKTATTFLQNTFADNRAVLEADGIIYPSIGGFVGHHTLASEWVKMPAKFQPLGGHERIWKRLSDAYADSDKTLVLSTEEFSRFKPQGVNIAQLRERLSAFDEVEVVCTLKPQDSFIQSIYLEVSKMRDPRPLITILEEAHRKHLVDGLMVNYNKLYAHLRTGFEKEEITLVPFNKAIKQEHGILGEFLKIVGYSKGIDTIEQVTIPVNVSADPLTMWIANTITAKKPLSKTVMGLIQETMTQRFPDGKKTTLFTEDEVEALATTFDPLNKKLAEKVAFKQPDFEIAPIKFNKSAINRRDIDSRFWTKFIRAHYQKNLVR